VAGGDDLSRAPLPADLDRLLHDLRGPLNAVVLHLEALKRLVGDDQMARGSLQSIQGEMERVAAMLPLAFAVCALELGARRRLLVRSIVESAVDESARKRVLVAPGPWPEVEGDERLLVLAVRHLILNALEAGDGDVHVGVANGAGVVTLTIEDSGGGFKARNPNAIIRLMQPGKPGHAGIGLLIAQRVARLHGGSLAFESRPAGAVVRMTIDAG
jgi:signal transduction histidine kinase